MWILIVGPERALSQSGSSAEVLRQLGCDLVCADVWDDLETLTAGRRPPTVIVIEAIEEVHAARAVVARCEEVDRLRGAAILVGVSVNGLGRLKADDPFDDFVLHPYVPAELYLRIRRAEWNGTDFRADERLKLGSLVLDLAGHEVHVDGRLVELTHQEFALLAFLCQHRGRVFSRDQLLKRVWGVDYYGGSRTVDIHVRRLRMKLGDGVRALETVRGVGYKMREEK